MENKLEQLFQVDKEEWLTTLPKYQQIRIKELVDSTNSYEEAAKQWLNAMPENTFPFGAEQARNLFIEKVRDEIEKFLSGDEKYADKHKQLVSSSEVLQKTLVSSVSAAIAPVIGTAAVYIMPVVVLVFMTMTKIADQPIVIAGQSSNAVLFSEADSASVQETLYLLSVPGMRESILEGMATPIEDCARELEW
jgi:PHD/YefM family antitoxin component YafN of YafNO toxin-antitoxin module